MVIACADCGKKLRLWNVWRPHPAARPPSAKVPNRHLLTHYARCRCGWEWTTERSLACP